MSERFSTNKKEVTAMSHVEPARKKEIAITNDMQVALVKFFRPEIQGKKEFSRALMDFIPIHGDNFRKIIDVDSRINSEDTILGLWCENRSQDPHKVLLFIKTQLDTLRICNSLIESTPGKIAKDVLKQKFAERLEQSLRERKGIL